MWEVEIKDLVLRNFEPEDYPAVASWWQAHGWPILPFEMLSDGLIVPGVCAGFLYETKKGGFAWLEYVVSNPESDKEIRNQALDWLISGLLVMSRDAQANVIFTSVKHPKLIERLAKHGFIVGDSEMTNLVRRL